MGASHGSLRHDRDRRPRTYSARRETFGRAGHEFSCPRSDRIERSPGRIRLAGRVTASPRMRRRGKSGHHRAGRSQRARTAGRRRKPTESGTENRPPAACSPETPPVRVKRWGKSPPATVVTRRLAKPRPVQGEQAPPRRPVKEPGSRKDGWSPSTESGLQACYGESPGNGAFSIRVPAGARLGNCARIVNAAACSVRPL